MTIREYKSEKNQLPVYIYKGLTGVLVEDMEAGAKFVPENEIGKLSDDTVLRVILDDETGGYTDSQEIVNAEVTNPENEQKLMVAWVSRGYALQDEMHRMLIAETDSHYDWTSDRTRFVEECIIPYLEQCEILEEKLKWYDKVGIDDEEEQADYDAMKAYIAEEPEKLRGKWADIVSQYKDPLGYYVAPALEELLAKEEQL